MTKFKIYFKGSCLGETSAVSPRKAINNMRFRCNIFAPIDDFEAVPVW